MGGKSPGDSFHLNVLKNKCLFFKMLVIVNMCKIIGAQPILQLGVTVHHQE
jgi:hypothetical protein